jgi:hypothetical protein
MSVIVALAAQYVGTLDLADTSVLALRVPQPPSIVTQSGQLKEVVVATDLMTSPSARLTLRGRRWSFLFSYSPSIAFPDAELLFTPTQPPHDPQILQSGSAAARWQGRVVRVVLTENGSYGYAPYYQVLTTPAPTTTPGETTGPMTMPGTQAPGQTMPPTSMTMMPGQMAAPGPATAGQTTNLQPVFISYGSSNTTGTIAANVGRRTTVSVFGGYSLNGGLGASAQALIPEQYGPNAGASLLYLPSVRDAFTTTLSAQQTTTSGVCPPPQVGYCVEQTPMAQAIQAVRHRLSAAATLTLSVGAATVDLQTATAQETVVMLIASGALAYRIGKKETLTVSVGLSPSVDFRTGLPTERLQTTVSILERLSRIVSLTATAGVNQSVPYAVPGSSEPTWVDPYPYTALTGTVAAIMGLDRLHRLTFGAQGSWLEQSGYGTVATVNEYATLTFGPQLLATVGLQEFWQDQAAIAGIVPSTGVSTSAYIAITARTLPLRF